MDIGMYNSYLEVDFGRMKESFRKVQAAAGRRGVIPVLKANAYGIGLVPMADFLVNTMNCDVMAVAQTSEGVLLRQAGFRQADIMLLERLERLRRSRNGVLHAPQLRRTRRPARTFEDDDARLLRRPAPLSAKPQRRGRNARGHRDQPHALRRAL